ncbi:DUF4082 domain-containing protein [Tardiphaga sp. P9-11]|nr:DUF4082 domain-containing protein [Tardiphaga sp. P9-11]
MPKRTAISLRETTIPHGDGGNCLYNSEVYGEAVELSEFVGHGIRHAPEGCLARAASGYEIKYSARAEFVVRSVTVDVPRGASAVLLRLDCAVVGMVPEQTLEVTLLPSGGRVWVAAWQDYLDIGDIIYAKDLAALQFMPFTHAAHAVSMLELRTIGLDGETVVVRVTISAEARAFGRAVEVQSRNVAAVDMDPLTFGLMTVLAASLVSSPVAAAPSRAPDGGAASDRLDGRVHADIARKGDDPAQDPAADEPSVTGSAPNKDGERARGPDAHRRWVGSGTPPDVWHSGETAIEKSTADHFDQLTVPARLGAIGFKDERVAAFDTVGSFGRAPAERASPQAVSGAPAKVSAAPPDASSITVPPVAGNDEGYLVLNGKSSIQATALLANDKASPGLHLSIDTVLAARHGTVTYDASSQEITFIALTGYRGNASFSYTVKDDEGRSAEATVTLFVVPDESLFDAGAQPALDRVNDPNPVELGVRFVSASDGVITGLRFYKGADNVGVHTASLWGASGTLLATATFSGETGSGWQQVAFSNPVAIRAGVSYVASYHTDGLYSADPGYFANPVTSGDLTAIGSAYAYGSSSAFPTNSYNASNYWVDVVYSRPPAAPEAIDDGIMAVGGGRSTSIASSLLLANDRNPDGLPLSITETGSAVNGAVSYDAPTQAVTFTPASGYSGPAGFSYTVTSSLGVSATADVKLWVAGTQPATVFDVGATPTIVKANDTNSVELGFKFQSTVNGDVVGLRFFKGVDNIGPHVGSLWNATGDLLATATFTNETTEGWQQVLFATPVSLTAGVTYVASYHTGGNYSADPGFFASSHDNGLLIAPASAPGSGNGLFAYGSSSLFPTDSFNATGYGVDALFRANLTG